jgi:arsenate reductase
MNKIYHNPRCGTSRTALQALQDRGVDVEIIEYLKTPLSRDELQQLISAAGISVRAAVREKEDIYRELGLDAPDIDDARLLDAMVEHPVLLNRPFVTTDKGTRLCRPATLIEEIL